MMYIILTGTSLAEAMFRTCLKAFENAQHMKNKMETEKEGRRKREGGKEERKIGEGTE